MVGKINSPELWIKDFPFPDENSNKYSRGHLAVIGGDIPMTGAARLTANAASRVCGLVTVFTPQSAFNIYAQTLQAVMVRNIDDNILETFSSKKVDAVVIGCGLGVSENTRTLLNEIIRTDLPVVIDADGLNILAEDLTVLRSRKNVTVLTPHEGEFKRLFPALNLGDKKTAVLQAAELTNSYVLLKGNETIIASPKGELIINTHSCPALSTAGSGDVLSGIIGGLLAAKMPVLKSLSAAVWLHGDAGIIGGMGINADDLSSLLAKSVSILYQNCA
jgi:ADP-dependent NAD(P)H-hydrate dehydratase / NAD(P)H-hydrate epimerase